MSILVAMGWIKPPQAANQPRLTKDMVEESNRRIQAMRDEAAFEKLTPEKPQDSVAVVDNVVELRDSVTRSEAQATFEASMRAKALRDSLKD